MAIIPRKIAAEIKLAMNISPIVFLNGPRQAGKSTLVQTLGEEFGKSGSVTYITLDRPTISAAAASEPEAFLSAYQSTLIIDEVQLVPELFRALKTVVDEVRLKDKAKANGRYLLTGSANIMALPKLSDPLVGRMNVLTLYPFCTSEAIASKGNGLDRLFGLEFQGINDMGLDLNTAISLSTFPELITMDAGGRRIWFDSYLTTLLQRDVKMLAEVEKASILPILLRILASRAGQLINDSDIARDAGLNSVTGKTYRNILKMMFVNFDVSPWYKNIGKRMVKSSKGYLTDTLMLCHLLDLNIIDIERNRPELYGRILENYVASELTKQLSFSETRAKLFHFRTSDNKEIDFVLERSDGSILAIEVKKSEMVHARDFDSIRMLQNIMGEEFLGGIILYTGKDAVPFGKNLWAVPIKILWQ